MNMKHLNPSLVAEMIDAETVGNLFEFSALGSTFRDLSEDLSAEMGGRVSVYTIRKIMHRKEPFSEIDGLYAAVRPDDAEVVKAKFYTKGLQPPAVEVPVEPQKEPDVKALLERAIDLRQKTNKLYWALTEAGIDTEEVEDWLDLAERVGYVGDHGFIQ